NTPLQALTLLNDSVFVECARALGKRIVTDKPGAGIHERIRYAFQLCLAREPLAGELATLSAVFDEFRQKAKANPDTAGKLIGQASCPRRGWRRFCAICQRSRIRTCLSARKRTTMPESTVSRKSWPSSKPSTSSLQSSTTLTCTAKSRRPTR